MPDAEMRGPAEPGAAGPPVGATQEPPPNFLEVAGVSHRFGSTEVLRAIDVTAARGEILLLLGPSGCGKSTLLRLVAGVEDLQEGRIAVGGEELAGPTAYVRPEARAVGLLPQDYALFPHFTVLDNVCFGLRDGTAASRRARGMEALAGSGMAAFADSFPHQLSGGEQQRVALARALAPRPRLLLLDEPFANLDVRLRGRLREETLRLLKHLGMTAIIVTHDAEEAMALGDRVALMDHGRIRQIGTPDALYRTPSDPGVAEFFGESNRFACRVVDGVAATPFGRVPAPGLREGGRVDALIRPESITVERTSSADDGVAGRIVTSRFLGRFSRITAQIRNHVAEPDESLRKDRSIDEVVAVLAGYRPFVPGETVQLGCNTEDILLFPE